MGATLFVTGTDTGVGKTRVAVSLLQALALRYPRVAGMKPVAAGLTQARGGWFNEDVAALRAASTISVPADWDNPVALREPMSPHLAAARAGRRIEVAELVRAHAALAAAVDYVVVEGAGGWRVPLNETDTLADLAKALGGPVILVVGLRLGCLNHALLTAEAIAADGLRLAGWVANAIDPELAAADDNVTTLQARLPAPLLARIPWQGAAAPDSLLARLQAQHLVAPAR